MHAHTHILLYYISSPTTLSYFVSMVIEVLINLMMLANAQCVHVDIH